MRLGKILCGNTISYNHSMIDVKSDNDYNIAYEIWDFSIAQKLSISAAYTSGFEKEVQKLEKIRS